MERPITPSQDDCCNSGCNPCIFDVYEKQLQLYNNKLEGKQGMKVYINLISEIKYTKFEVAKITNLNVNHKLIAFQYSDDTEYNIVDRRLYYEPTQYFLLRLQNENIHTTKPYTPIQLETSNNVGILKDQTYFSFQIIVKIYDGGVYSHYLDNLTVGDSTLWRGPYGSHKYLSNKYCKIFFITQGTGIVGVYTLIKHILGNENDMTVLHMFCFYKNYETILLRNELYNMKQYWNFNYSIYLSNTEEVCITPKYREAIIPHKFDFAVLGNEIIHTDNTGFYLCGSSEFMTYYKQSLIVKGVNCENIISLES